MPTTRIPVIEVKQNSRIYYVSKLKASEIANYTTVDRYRPDLPSVDHPDQGYQRVAEPARYKKFANYLIKEEHPLCPTALLLSGRNIDLNYDKNSDTIELNTEMKLQIIDGQHRAEGYKFAIFDKKVERLIDFEVPIIIVPKIDKINEMRQFAVINGTQKGVRLDLVNMILTQVAKRAGEDQLDKKELPRVIISRVVESLNNEHGSPWHGLIIMPNEKAQTKKELRDNPTLANCKIVYATSFMTSLKPLYAFLDEFDFLRGDAAEQSRAFASILIKYWNAIKSLLPDALETPSQFVIQKTPGIFALHTVCRTALRNLFKLNKGWTEAEFVRLLEHAEAMTDSSFWLADNGEAAKYGSMKGFAELARIIESQMS